MSEADPTAGAPGTPVALILGAAVWPGGEPSPTLRRRALDGARLFLQGEVTHLIACGGTGRHPPSEAEVIDRLCRAERVPAPAILLEDRSTTTFENITNALPLLERLGTRNVVIVTDAYHLPRAILTARRLGLTARGSAPPASGIPLFKRLKSRLREIPAYLWYSLRPALRPGRRAD